MDTGSTPALHTNETAEVIERLEPIVAKLRTDLVLVVGGVNSTLAAPLTAVKLYIPVARVRRTQRVRAQADAPARLRVSVGRSRPGPPELRSRAFRQ